MTRKIKNTGRTQREIDPKVLARDLGAENAGIKIDTKQGVMSLFGLREFVMERLCSSGGRPALIGTIKRRNKIPFFKGDWGKLKMLAKYYKEKEGINVSPGQIASVLIHADIAKINTEKLSSLETAK